MFYHVKIACYHTQRGYRVYFPDMRHYITSIDVTFHEDVPYFSSSTTPLRAPISLPLIFPLFLPPPCLPLMIF